MRVRQLFDADTWTYTYLLAGDGEAALVDPVRDQVDRDLELVAELGLSLKYAIDTHVHADHLTGAGLLRERTGCQIVASVCGPESADIRLADGDALRLGSVELKGLLTPGHTDDSISYYVPGHVFTGDTLFVRGCGRTDFQNGDAQALFDSITTQLFTLPDDTRIWPGHDYRGHTTSTIGEEKRHNPRLAGKNREQFVALMQSLELPAPKYLHHAVPANQEVGLGLAPDTQNSAFSECTSEAIGQKGRFDQIIDVRQPHEFSGELGHIPGATNIPMGQMPGAVEQLDRERALLIVCRSGRRSREVCQQLAQLGFERLTNLRGGMLDYREHGLEVA